MKEKRHDPTTCLLSAKYAWKRRNRSVTAEGMSWVWLFRLAGIPVYVEAA